MPRFPVSPYWSANPSVPIFLDTGNDRESPPPPPKDEKEHICPTCETSSRDQPIHCISTPEAPPSYTSITEKDYLSTHLTVPVLRIKTPSRWDKPQPPLPALQFDPEGRPHVRFRRNAFSPLSPAMNKDDGQKWDRKSSLGLAIPDAPFRPDRSPVTPGTVEKADEHKTEALGGTSNFAQRIEEKLWKYSASGNIVKRWLLEIISWSLSAACMAGIGIVLFIYKGQRIPSWPLGLTLNAYISVLSKVASAGLLLPVSEALGQLKWSWFNKENSKKMWDFEIFDNASRGPWGSLLLLVRTKGKSLAALGAAVTIFALALDPFFQQVVEYPEHWRLQPGNGTIPRAISYKPNGLGTVYRRDSGQRLDLDPDILGVASRFFYDNGTAPITFGRGVRAEVPLTCPHSNCTWPKYETLGIRSECTEVPELLDFRCMNTTLDWIQIPDSNPDTGVNVYRNGTACGWWLNADKPLLMVGYTTDQHTNHSGETLLMRNQPLYDVFTRAPLPGYPARLNHTRNPLAHGVIVSGIDVDNVLRNGTPIAHECIISWCIKEMLSEYSEGGYNETVQNIFVNSTLGSDPWLTYESFDENGKVTGYNYFYFENVTLTSPMSNFTFEIDNVTQAITLALFDEVFPSQSTLVNSTNETDVVLRYKEYITINPWIRNVTYNPFMFNNISAHFDRMSEAMTNLIRSSGERTESMNGSAYDKESIVDVRWEWLSLPLALLGLTLVFLVATIIRSSMESEHIGVYKTSAIATLLYGLPDEMQKKIKSSQSKGTPRANAKEAKVKWVPRAGWRFSGNTLSPSSTTSPHSPPVEWSRKRDIQA